ncbi:DgyrCDS5596 [Dimorphilus gyrociliatus]|uniref:DgyrCDS5596 n=1 Tax=Dimorphilus gyrociliatus TaxID=2664684 RepID=A0A7I8VN26_9ANNE|nr:DgyrCDS5596 [Dimorphilus gyrociliatus]
MYHIIHVKLNEGGSLLHSTHIQTWLKLGAVSLQFPQISQVIGSKERKSWVCTAVAALYQLVCTVVLLPGQKLTKLKVTSEEEYIPKTADELHHTTEACDRISELMYALSSQLSFLVKNRALPDYILYPLRNVIIGIARLPLVNSYARTPMLAWRLGWIPSVSGENRTSLPPLPQELLMEREVLIEFIRRINCLGWISRTQFEETWMSLLGVLSPAAEEGGGSVQDIMERNHCSSLALRAMTALLQYTTLAPHSGNPASSSTSPGPRSANLYSLRTR